MMRLDDDTPIRTFVSGHMMDPIDERPSFDALARCFPGCTIRAFSYNGLVWRWFIELDGKWIIGDT